MFIQNFIDKYHKIKDYHILISDYNELIYCKEIFNKNNLKYEIIGETRNKDSIDVEFRVTGKGESHKKLVQQIRSDNKIIGFEY